MNKLEFNFKQREKCSAKCQFAYLCRAVETRLLRVHNIGGSTGYGVSLLRSLDMRQHLGVTLRMFARNRSYDRHLSCLSRLCCHFVNAVPEM